MIPAAIPRRYARALLLHAADKGLDPEAVAAELEDFAALVTPGTSLHGFLTNAVVPAGRKAEVFGRLLEKSSPSPALAGFLTLLLEKGRLTALPEIAAEYRRLADDRAGIVRGEVVVAADLPEETLASLREKLAVRLSRKVVLTVRKDPAVIGGVIVRVGSLSFDGSIRAQLQGIREQLMERVNS